MGRRTYHVEYYTPSANRWRFDDAARFVCGERQLIANIAMLRMQGKVPTRAYYWGGGRGWTTVVVWDKDRGFVKDRPK